MKENFYLVYGYEGDLDLENLAENLKQLFDLEIEFRESDYYGQYYLCKGLYVDKLLIYDNSGDIVETLGKYSIIVDLSIITGKNKDRISKYKMLKIALGKVKGLFLLKDRIIASPRQWSVPPLILV